MSCCIGGGGGGGREVSLSVGEHEATEVGEGGAEGRSGGHWGRNNGPPPINSCPTRWWCDLLKGEGQRRVGVGGVSTWCTYMAFPHGSPTCLIYMAHQHGSLT